MFNPSPSLLSILLLTLHITDGQSSVGIIEGRALKLALGRSRGVCCTGTAGARPNGGSGYVIMLLVGFVSRQAWPGHPHEGGHIYGEIAQVHRRPSSFVWDTLGARRGLGGFTFILSARGLWSLPNGASHGSSNNPEHGKAPIWRLSAALRPDDAQSFP